MQDIRYAFRQLRATPGLTATIVLSLALGIGANTAIFSLINAVLLAPLPVRSPQELVMLGWGGDQWPTGLNQSGASSPDDAGYRLGSYSLPYPFFQELQAKTDSIAAVFGFVPLGIGRQNTSVVVDGESARVDGEMVTGDYFTGLGVAALVGRVLTPEDAHGQSGAAVISYRYWMRSFAGDRDVPNRRVFVNGLPFAIVGVMPPSFVGAEPGRTPDIWVPAIDSPALTPWGFRPTDNPSLIQARTYWWLPVMVRLKPHVDAARLRSELEPRFQRFTGEALGIAAGDRAMPHLLAMPATRGHDISARGFSRPLFILMAVVGLVLLIACANVATLLLARATARRREIAIRLSLGASRARLVRQLLTESLVTAVLGGAVGSLLAVWGARTLVLLLPADQQPDVATGVLRFTVLAFTAGVSILTGVLFGLAPAVQATRLEVAGDLKATIGATAARAARRRLGGGFVIAQVALSLVLLFGAGLFIRTLVQLQREQLGVDTRHVLVVDMDATQNGYTGPRLAALYETILERLQALPGVQGVTASRLALFSGWVSNGPIAIAGLEAKTGGMTIYWNAVAPSFAETMGLKVRVGRSIGWDDLRAARRVAVINEAAAQYFFGGANPLGRTFSFGAQMKPAEQYEVIGVVQNAKYGSVRGAMPRTAYVPFTAMTATLSGLSFALRTAADPSAVVPALRRVVRELDANVALANVRSETDQIATSLWQERLFADLMTAFGLLAILLASVGIYGTMSYAVARRTREIGLRMAIGAQRDQVLRLILGGAMRLTLIGVVLGVPVTLAASRLVGSELFGVTPADPQTMTAAIVVLVAIMAGASYWPAYRASRVDPMTALRTD